MKAPPSIALEIVDLGERNGRKTLRVTAPWEQVAADYEDIVDAYCRVGIPGFRSGRAPRPIMEKRFQREIRDDLSRRCGPRLSREALRRAGAESLGPIGLTDIACGNGKPFQFLAHFTPMPQIELPDPASLAFPGEGPDPRGLISARLLELVRFEIPDDLIRIELGSDTEDEPSRQSAQWTAAEQRVRLLLILKRIARREGIEVDEEDVDRRIAEKAVEFGTNPRALKSELEKGGGRQRLKDMLLAESTLDFLTEKSARASATDRASEVRP